MQSYTELRDHWRKSLQGIYDMDETDALFYDTCYRLKGWGKSRVVFEKDTLLTPDEWSSFENILKPLKTHRPIQYIFGDTEFYNLQFKVDEDVLIPRPETAELVDWIVKDHLGKRNLKVLDIGTGSGCIAIALKKNLVHASVFALDVSAHALTVAQINADFYQVEINMMQADIFDLAEMQSDELFDIIVSNPPYILPSEKVNMKQNVLGFEPHIALFTQSEDPLEFYRPIVSFAKLNLNQKGKIYLETNEQYTPFVAAFLSSSGFNEIEIKKDLQGKERFIKAVLPPQP